jgi:hypothetical protein
MRAQGSVCSPARPGEAAHFSHPTTCLSPSDLPSLALVSFRSIATSARVRAEQGAHVQGGGYPYQWPGTQNNPNFDWPGSV